VRKNDSESVPEQPDQSGRTLRVVVSATQYDWLGKQCAFMGIPKEQLVVDAMEEWLCRNREVVIPVDLSRTVQRALNEFMDRHRDEFLPSDSE
jgi:hypothetical protein